MQFIGSITIIADIIGPEKIRRFGVILQGTITSIILIQFLKDCFKWYLVIFRHTLMKDYEDETTSGKLRFNPSKLDILNYLLSFLLTVLIVSSMETQQGWVLLLESAVIFGCLLISVSPVITVSMIMILILSGLIINSMFIRPLAWTLEHPSLDRFTKIISLFLLLIGFHFELLAS